MAGDARGGPIMLIGLTGYGGVGKTAIANILREQHGFGGPHIKAPFANMTRTLLREAGIAEDMIERYVDGDLKRAVIPEIGKDATYLQQTLGFDWGRDLIRPDIWLDLWMKKVSLFEAAGGSVVQESVRAQNEVDSIRACRGWIVEVRRPGVGPLPGGHRSEFLIPDPDRVVSNDGSLDELATKVAELLAS